MQQQRPDPQSAKVLKNSAQKKNFLQHEGQLAAVAGVDGLRPPLRLLEIRATVALPVARTFGNGIEIPAKVDRHEHGLHHPAEVAEQEDRNRRNQREDKRGHGDSWLHATCRFRQARHFTCTLGWSGREEVENLPQVQLCFFANPADHGRDIVFLVIRANVVDDFPVVGR